MPGIDIYAQLGSAAWTTASAETLQRAVQRVRFDLMGVASRRALAGDIVAGNAEVKALVDAVPQARGWVVINPTYPEHSAAEMKRYGASNKFLGCALIGGIEGERLDSPAVREILNSIRRYTKPVLVQVPNEDAARDLEAIALEFSTLNFVAAGAGGDHWPACAFAAKRAVNIHLEPLSGGPHRGKLEGIVATIGPRRVLFGSGFPDQNPGAAWGMLEEAKLSDSEKQQIVLGNAIRLFNLSRGSEG
jgi:predicted TIM-barrel fold metal-dependent hydrolase